MTNKRNETTNLSFYTFIMSELKKKKKELPYPLGVGVRKQSEQKNDRKIDWRLRLANHFHVDF